MLRLHLPTLWVGAAHGNFDQNLIGIWSWNRRVHDQDREVGLDNYFFHVKSKMWTRQSKIRSNVSWISLKG